MANERRLIDVNHVIDAMQKVLDEEKENKKSVAYFAFESIIECLKQEPTVDAVEVVHGRWARVEADLGVGIKTHRFACSECGFLKNTLTGNYCPNCGAKMDKEDNYANS